MMLWLTFRRLSVWGEAVILMLWLTFSRLSVWAEAVILMLWLTFCRLSVWGETVILMLWLTFWRLSVWRAAVILMLWLTFWRLFHFGYTMPFRCCSKHFKHFQSGRYAEKLTSKCDPLLNITAKCILFVWREYFFPFHPIVKCIISVIARWGKKHSIRCFWRGVREYLVKNF